MAAIQLQAGCQSHVSGIIKNKVDATQLTLEDSKIWCGKMMKEYPDNIIAGDSATFIQEGDDVKGAVIYAEGAGENARKWLVAFHYPAKQVYVKAGISIGNWNDIEACLDNSESISTYKDPNFGGSAEAQIHDDGKLRATFGN